MRDNKLAPVLAIVGGAIVLVVALVVANQISGNSKKTSADNITIGSINEMLNGIPQKGIELGNPKAKVTVVEFADPQCPACGDFGRNTLPSLIQDYVRTGKVRIEYRGLHFVDNFVKNGPKDSARLLRLAEAAGLQKKLWNIVELEYENQGAENSGYATDAFLRGIAEAVPELNADKALAAADTNVVVPNIDAAKALADKSFKQLSTPSFLIGPTGGKPSKTIVGAQALSVFVKAIDAELRK